MKNLMIAIVLISPCLGDVSHILSEYPTMITTTPPRPPRSYDFVYQAGRYPGNVDRVHQERGDGAGHVQGAYSFIDPNHKVRTVHYTADDTGFHERINYADTFAQPVDSGAVMRGNEEHFRLYKKIAEANSYPQKDTSVSGRAKDFHLQLYQKIAEANSHPPKDTSISGRAKDFHLKLYQKIANDHAAIGAEREAGRG